MSAAARTITEADWFAKGRELFGDDRAKWRFQCAGCGRVTSADEARAAHPESEALRTQWRVYQECVGRHVSGVGCNWAAYGIFSGPIFVVIDGAKQGEQPMPVFDFEGRPLAPNPLLTNNPPPLAESSSKEGAK